MTSRRELQFTMDLALRVLNLPTPFQRLTGVALICAWGQLSDLDSSICHRRSLSFLLTLWILQMWLRCALW